MAHPIHDHPYALRLMPQNTALTATAERHDIVIIISSLLFLLVVFLLFGFFTLLSFAVNAVGAICLLVFLVLALILLGFLLLLLRSVLNLVFDQVVEGSDSTNQTAEIDGHELIICLDAHCVCQLAIVRGGVNAVGDA